MRRLRRPERRPERLVGWCHPRHLRWCRERCRQPRSRLRLRCPSRWDRPLPGNRSKAASRSSDRSYAAPTSWLDSPSYYPSCSGPYVPEGGVRCVVPGKTRVVAARIFAIRDAQVKRVRGGSAPCRLATRADAGRGARRARAIVGRRDLPRGLYPVRQDDEEVEVEGRPNWGRAGPPLPRRHPGRLQRLRGVWKPALQRVSTVDVRGTLGGTLTVR